MEGKHTGGKWTVIIDQTEKNLVYITSDMALRADICDLYHRSPSGALHAKANAKDDAERIVACVNALKGISNEALKENVIKETIEVLRDIGDVGDCDNIDTYRRLKRIVAKLEV